MTPVTPLKGKLMNKFVETVKTHKSEIIKGAFVIAGSAAGFAIGLGFLDSIGSSDELDFDVETTDTPDTSDSTETD